MIQFSNQVTGEGSGTKELLKPSTVPINLSDAYLKTASTQLAIMNQKLRLWYQFKMQGRLGGSVG